MIRLLEVSIQHWHACQKSDANSCGGFDLSEAVILASKIGQVGSGEDFFFLVEADLYIL
jgi:hypothetical protein